MTTLGKILGGGMAIGAIAGRADILDESSILRNVAKAEKVIIGGGTYSCNPMSMTAGLATLSVIDARRDEIYPQLERRNRDLCERMASAFEKNGIAVTITAPASLHAVHFTRDQGRPVRNMEDVVNHTDPAKQHELADRLRVHGVFQFHASAISTAHGDDDIDRIAEAVERCAGEMAEHR